MNIKMKNSKTSEIKEIKVGWSWVLFLFSGFLGIPLFLRKLHIWGAVMFGIWVVQVIAPSATSSDPNEQFGLFLILSLMYIGFSIFFGIKGNEMTAKNYLENGWVFVEPEAEATKIAKLKWGISI